MKDRRNKGPGPEAVLMIAVYFGVCGFFLGQAHGREAQRRERREADAAERLRKLEAKVNGDTADTPGPIAVRVVEGSGS